MQMCTIHLQKCFKFHKHVPLTVTIVSNRANVDLSSLITLPDILSTWGTKPQSTLGIDKNKEHFSFDRFHVVQMQTKPKVEWANSKGARVWTGVWPDVSDTQYNITQPVQCPWLCLATTRTCEPILSVGPFLGAPSEALSSLPSSLDQA